MKSSAPVLEQSDDVIVGASEITQFRVAPQAPNDVDSGRDVGEVELPTGVGDLLRDHPKYRSTLLFQYHRDSGHPHVTGSPESQSGVTGENVAEEG